MHTRLALLASRCLLVSPGGARSTVLKASSGLLRSSAGPLLALIGLMMGFIAPGYCQDRPVSAMGATALTALPPWTPTGNLNTRRSSHTATLLPSGKVLVAGGWIDDYTPTNSAELYDIGTGTWSVTGSLNSAYYDHTATLLLDGKVLVVGTTVAGDGNSFVSSELYDPVTGTWSPDTKPPERNAESTTLLPNGTALVVWYAQNSDDVSCEFPPRADLYEPATHAWLPAATPTSIHNFDSTATLLQDGKVLVVGGNAEGGGNCSHWEWAVPTRAEVYDPVFDSWKQVGTAVFIGLHTATLLPSGKVLIAGGDLLPGTWPLGMRAKLYDPAAETFTDTGNLTVGRTCCHTATLLPDGKVLVAGGRGQHLGSSAELYDPGTGMWTSTGSLNAGRFAHTATLLPDGRVLVAGGRAEDSDVLNSAEIYYPDLANQPPVITQDPVDRTVAAGTSASFAVVASGTPPLAYQWQRNGFDISGATSATYTLAAAAVGDSGARFRCVVANAFGSDTSAEATLTVPSNTPPTGTITSPAVSTQYQAGDTITYAGTGTDAEDSNLPTRRTGWLASSSNLRANAFTWRVDFYHNDGTLHFHPFIPATSGSMGGSFVIPRSGETSPNVFYRIWLTVTDSGGLTHTSFRDVLPRTSTITLATNPPGLSLTLDGQPYTAPVVGVAGMIRSIGAPTPQVMGDMTYAFRWWTDGGRATHNITTRTTNTTYTARFRPRTSSWGTP